MEKSYAQALSIMIENGIEPAKAIRALHTRLTHDGRQALMPKIASAFKKLADRKKARENMVLTVSHEQDTRHAQKEVAVVLKKLNLQNTPIEILVDETLIGGWRLEGRDYLIDESHKKHLLAIYTAATT